MLIKIIFYFNHLSVFGLHFYPFLNLALMARFLLTIKKLSLKYLRLNDLTLSKNGGFLEIFQNLIIFVLSLRVRQRRTESAKSGRSFKINEEMRSLFQT
jgi:hypothetical protein